MIKREDIQVGKCLINPDTHKVVVEYVGTRVAVLKMDDDYEYSVPIKAMSDWSYPEEKEPEFPWEQNTYVNIENELGALIRATYEDLYQATLTRALKDKDFIEKLKKELGLLL